MNANDKNQSAQNKKKTPIKSTNVLESLRSLGGGVSTSLKQDLLKPTMSEATRQLFGPRLNKNYSGEINPGESMEMGDVFSGKREAEEKLKNQLVVERKLREEEKSRIETKSNELKLQLHALMNEIAEVAKGTQELGEETMKASIQAPVEPGIYHVVFFEKLLEFLKSFRKKINSANVWLASANSRAQKKNYWAKYKKHGGKFLLSGEHYLTRSAG